MYRSVLAPLFASALLLSGCAVGQQTVPKEKSGQETNMDGAAFDRSDEEITYMDTKDNVIYLAGGCFWGMEQLMQSIPGVIDAESGYANGTCEADADYKTVCKGETGFRETVRVEYDPEQVSLDALLLARLYKAYRGPRCGGKRGFEPRDAPHGGQKPRRRFSPWSCVHRRSGVPQWRALLHQQCGPALCALRKDESRGLRISSVSVRGMSSQNTMI